MAPNVLLAIPEPNHRTEDKGTLLIQSWDLNVCNFFIILKNEAVFLMTFEVGGCTVAAPFGE